MKKLLLSITLAAMVLPVLAAETSDKAAEKPACCAKHKGTCSDKDKAQCHKSGSCKEKEAKKSAATNVKGAELLKQ